MESTAQLPTLTWLDEERRRDRAQLEALSKLVRSQSALIENLIDRVEDLDARLIQTRTQVLPPDALHQATQQIRDEFSRWAEEHKQALAQAGTTLNQGLEEQGKRIETLARQAQDLADETARIKGQMVQIPARLDNQASQTGELGKKLQELAEETVRAQSRLAQLPPRLDEHALRSEELGRRLQALAEELLHLEDQVARLPTRLDEQSSQVSGLGRRTQELAEGLAALRVQQDSIPPRIDQHTADIVGIAQRVQELVERLPGLEDRLARVPVRLDDHSDHLADQARRIQGLSAGLEAVRAEMPELRQRDADHITHLGGLARRLEELQGQLSQTQSQLGRFTKVEESMANLRRELVLLIEAHEQSHTAQAGAAAKLRQQDQARQVREIGEIRKELEIIPRLDERLTVLAAEDTRLSQAIQTVQSETSHLRQRAKEQHEQQKVLEDHQRHEVQRVEKVETQIRELLQAQTTHASRLRFLEEWGQRSAEQIGELKRFEEHLQRQQAELAETQRLADDRRVKQMAEWHKEIEAQRQQMAAWDTDLSEFAEQHKANRKLMSDLQALGERLERNQHEAMEMQRIAEERQRKELQQWQEDNSKRWKQFMNDLAFHREEQAKLDRRQSDRLMQLETWQEAEMKRAGEVGEWLEEQRRERLSQIAALWRAQEAYAQQRITELKQRLEEINEQIPNP